MLGVSASRKEGEREDVCDIMCKENLCSLSLSPPLL